MLAVTLSGDVGWAEVTLQLEVYPYQPGLLHTRLTATLHNPPPEGPALEWTFVDPATGKETSAGFTVYADPAPMCAPVLYGYAQILDSTLFYAVDRTALNPFMQAAHYTPSATPGRRGRSFGHTIDAANLRALPAGEPFVLYDGYLYLTPGEPDDEAEMFARYLRNLGDVYDLLHQPVNEPVLSKVEGTLPDWRALAEKTIADLADEHPVGGPARRLERGWRHRPRGVRRGIGSHAGRRGLPRGRAGGGGLQRPAGGESNRGWGRGDRHFQRDGWAMHAGAGLWRGKCGGSGDTAVRRGVVLPGGKRYGLSSPEVKYQWVQNCSEGIPSTGSGQVPNPRFGRGSKASGA